MKSSLNKTVDVISGLVQKYVIINNAIKQNILNQQNYQQLENRLNNLEKLFSDNSSEGSSSSELKFTLAGSKYNRGIEGGEYILNGEYIETEDSKTTRNGSFDNCTIHAVNKDNSDYTIQIQIGVSSSDTFGTGIIKCYVSAPEGIIYEVSSMFGYSLFNYNDEGGTVSLTLTSNNSTLNNTAAFQALQTKFLNQ